MQPDYRQILRDARNAALSAMTPDQKCQREADHKSRLERRAARREVHAQRQAEKVAKIRLWTQRLMHGDTPEEIADALGVTEFALRNWSLRWGVALMQRKGFRRLAAWVSFPHVAALDALASDLGLSREKAMATLLDAALSDGAHVARRTLGVQRRAVA